jgi:hypothetical protein
MLDVVTNSTVGMVLRLLPGFMLKRIFKVSQLQEEFEITLSGSSPVKISTNPSTPFVEVNLRFTNKSAIPVIIDRVLFEVGNIPADFANLRRWQVGSKKTIEYVPTRHFLNELQRQSIERCVDTQTRHIKDSVRVQILVIGDSRIGPFTIDKHFSIGGDAMPSV